jgi:hypothetical protein
MATTRKSKTSTARRPASRRAAAPPAIDKPPTPREQIVMLDELARRRGSEISQLRDLQRRDRALLTVGVVYLACALVLVAYVWGRKSR